MAHRNGFFSEVLLEILDENESGHSFSVEDIRPFLRDGFPWHFSEHPHPELNDPSAWWAFVERSFVRAFEGLGVSAVRAVHYAKQSHKRYIDSSGFHLYEDTTETLQHFVDTGWRNVILSNHVPELPDIVGDLLLDRYVSDCISSANVGFEKPNRALFELAIERAGNPVESWMIGDNPVADVEGAERAGIPAVLVRRENVTNAPRYAPRLYDVIPIVERGAPR